MNLWVYYQGLLFFTISALLIMYYITKSISKSIGEDNHGRNLRYYINEKTAKQKLTPKKFERWKKKNMPKGIHVKEVYGLDLLLVDIIISLKGSIKRIKIKLKRWRSAYP